MPQVAAMADNHLFILKEENKERVKTKVMPLSDDQKVEEVARMLSGVEVTEITLENAKELLNMAKKRRSTFIRNATQFGWLFLI